MYVKEWASATNSLLKASKLEDWVATLVPKVDPPAGRGRAHFPAHLLTEVPDERIEAMVQEHIMNCLLGLLRVASKYTELKAVMENLQPFLASVGTQSFKEDIARFSKMVLVESAGSCTDVNNARSCMKRILNEEAPSRFLKALKLFPTGHEVVGKVDSIFLACKGDGALSKQLERLQSFAWQGPLPLLHTDAGDNEHVCYSRKDLFEACAGTWRTRLHHAEDVRAVWPATL